MAEMKTIPSGTKCREKQDLSAHRWSASLTYSRRIVKMPFLDMLFLRALGFVYHSVLRVITVDNAKKCILYDMFSWFSLTET